MSHQVHPRFPSGHTIEQVKRNAKRLSEERSIPLNKALDQLACKALGLPENFIRWAEAIRALEVTAQYYGFTGEPVFPEITRMAFNEGVLVSIDVKDAERFRDTGPWVHDELLEVMMAPTLMALSALSGAHEDNRKIPNKIDWEYAFEDLTNDTIYRFNGEHQFKNETDVINDIRKRNFFPPALVWIGGELKPLMHNVNGGILILD